MIKTCSIANVMLIITRSAGKYPLVGNPAHANLYMSFQTNNPNCIFTYKFSLLTLKEPFWPLQGHLAHPTDRPKLNFTLHTITAPKLRLSSISHLEKIPSNDSISSTSILYKLFFHFHRKTVIEQKLYAKGHIIIEKQINLFISFDACLS